MTHVSPRSCSSSLQNPTGGKAFRVFAVIWKTTLKGQSAIKHGHFTSSRPTHYDLTTHHYVYPHSKYLSLSSSDTKSVAWPFFQGFPLKFTPEWISAQKKLSKGCLVSDDLACLCRADGNNHIGLPWTFYWHDIMTSFFLTLGSRVRHHI